MTTSQDRETNKHLSKKLRSACDICHQAKMKCSGGTPCQGCRSSDHECIYSVSKRIGRPKGTKNKRTADRVSRQQSEKERKSHKNEHGSQVPPSSPAPGQISRAKPQTLTIDNGTGQRPATMGNTSIDTLLRNASNIPYSLPGSEGHGQFANNMSPWYNFGDLAETSPLKVSMAWCHFIVWLWRVVASSHYGTNLIASWCSCSLPSPRLSNRLDPSRTAPSRNILTMIQHMSPRPVFSARWEASLLYRFLPTP